MNIRHLPITICLGFVIGLAACSPEPKITSGRNTVVSGKAAIGGAYELINHHGQPVTDKTFHGRPQLIYFGFAYCPDICPTALQQMAAAIELATQKNKSIKADLQTILITVDPDRDTVEQMALYVTNRGFPKNLIGLTGTSEQIEVVKKAYVAIGQRVQDPSNVAGYTYDHTSLIYLMDERGDFVDVFTHGDSTDDIAAGLLQYFKSK